METQGNPLNFKRNYNFLPIVRSLFVLSLIIKTKCLSLNNGDQIRSKWSQRYNFF